ncbi:hypothetical protein Fleli_0489 [Bernardetia litoralis DSM 6794]|uniref:Uncharacterized protein n=1 Tax=Bernardetia litoralis (strain ATCC 23117 / DSM 6794 / NBRC 15988 / NCIMB 1366 / Fx l1 / Sio-4) TaxID=880071 RepID=I4AG80_BERLS|nr:hypothetical protein [Bernardetia litoralis]AFM02965.1 hypothetical protein Fleli_0489 [Bernardetia litoralis DSM 6794]
MKNLPKNIALLLLVFINTSCINKDLQLDSIPITLSDDKIAYYTNYPLVKIENQFKDSLHRFNCVLDTVEVSFAITHENNINLDSLFFIISASSGFDIKSAFIYKGYYKPIINTKMFKICCSRYTGVSYSFWAIDKRNKNMYKWSAKASSLKYKSHYDIELLYEPDKFGDRYDTKDFFHAYSPPTDGSICKCLSEFYGKTKPLPLLVFSFGLPLR